MWQQPPENTLESLRHAIQHNDGIEFDVRLTQDQELVIHHDVKISVPKAKQPHSFAWTENHTLDELTSQGWKVSELETSLDIKFEANPSTPAIIGLFKEN